MTARGKGLLLAGLSGLVFGIGLLLSGMTQPARVIAFLDVTRGWDPTLAFVMGGAVMINLVATRLILGRDRPWFDGSFHLPPRTDIDAPLLAGAAIFGVGWGLGGLCPGPGLVVAASGATTGLAFLGAMVLGMLIQHQTRRG